MSEDAPFPPPPPTWSKPKPEMVFQVFLESTVSFKSETSLGWFGGELNGNVKMRPHYVARQNGTKCGLAARQMARIMWTSMQHSLGRASSCRGITIRSAKCRSHQRFAGWHMMSRESQNYISYLEKKIRRSLLVSFPSFCNLRKRFFFMWTRSNWRHRPSNFCCAAKLLCVAFCRVA